MVCVGRRELLVQLPQLIASPRWYKREQLAETIMVYSHSERVWASTGGASPEWFCVLRVSAEPSLTPAFHRLSVEPQVGMPCAGGGALRTGSGEPLAAPGSREFNGVPGQRCNVRGRLSVHWNDARPVYVRGGRLLRHGRGGIMCRQGLGNGAPVAQMAPRLGVRDLSLLGCSFGNLTAGDGG